jgi:hypothetical protein
MLALTFLRDGEKQNVVLVALKVDRAELAYVA